MSDWLRKTNPSASFDADREPCYGSHVGAVRPTLSPLGRRELIRAAFEAGEWQVAAANLHQANITAEWRGCGLRSWSAYLESLPISRMYDWQLRFVHRTGTVQPSYTFRAALKHARSDSARAIGGHGNRASHC